MASPTWIISGSGGMTARVASSTNIAWWHRFSAPTGTRQGPARMTKQQITAAIATITDLMQALRHAATEDKAAIYAGLNVQLTYHPGERIVAVQAGISRTCTKGS